MSSRIKIVDLFLPRSPPSLHGCLTDIELARKLESPPGIGARAISALHVWSNAVVPVLHRINFQHDEQVFVGLLNHFEHGKRFQWRKDRMPEAVVTLIPISPISDPDVFSDAQRFVV